MTRTKTLRIGFFSLLAAMLLAGCAEQPKPVASAPPPSGISPSDYDNFKNMYLSTNPDARVGRVEAVLPDDHRLAVGDIPTSDFQVGDVVSILDGSLNVVADGKVVEVSDDLLYVKYYPPVNDGSQQPQPGELAVRAETPDRDATR